jgi:glycosyltransferase involved in cell wall biosynthesis
MPGALPGILDSDAALDLDAEQREILHTTRWDWWRHGEFWCAHLKRLARLADHVVVVSPENLDTSIKMLDIEPDAVTAIANGVDLHQFAASPGTARDRRSAFRRWLVEDPQGWSATAPPGSIAYTEADLDRLLGPDDRGTVLLYVGRFTAAKRVPNLIRAFARARDRFEAPGSLVIWGGHPGEWEGEHPVDVATEVGSDGIFFVGWRGHDDLPSGLAACDALVVASVDDAYPQTPLEAMAVGLPVIAGRSGGLPSIVDVDPARPTGWLVAPDDVDALADALVTAVNDPAETAARGANARAHAAADLSWDGLVSRFEPVYAMAGERHRLRTQQGEQ